MPASRGYSSGKFALELEGKAAGFLHSVEGGEPFGTVVTEPVGPDGIRKKHIGQVDVEPIVITFGVGMAKEVYAWIAEVPNRQQKSRSGAIVFLNYDFTEVERLEWNAGLITEVVFPALDAAATDQALLTVTITPASTRLTSSSGKAHPGFTTKTQKKAMRSNFRLTVSDLDRASAKVKNVSAITISQPIVAEEGGLEHRGPARAGTVDISNVVVTLPQSSAQPWLDWVDEFLVKGIADDASERTATLQLLDQSLKDPLFTLTLSHVGPVRARRKLSTADIEAVSLVDVELYCESATFVPAAESAGSSVASTPTTPSGTSPLPPSSTSTDAVLALLAAAGAGIDTQRALKVLQASSLAGNPELVAARLKTTTAASSGAAANQRKRADGESLGERWASERASLDELQQIARLDSGDWTSIHLPDDHSLITQLREVGIVPPGGEGALQLTRDEFVEGIVAGTARVFRAAQPHL